ncbi:Accessory gene regulator B [Pelotomaculum sp. FP]|nr:Accessory gene regulator B [Pelotomaculum sp. FP]
MVHEISIRITNYIASELKLEKARLDIISYGIEVMLGGLVKWSIFIIVPLLFIGVRLTRIR